jgi:uncharacterized protein YbbK (DUF523 family)
MILVSACLAGAPCRYNGRGFICPSVAALVAAGKAIAVCPEVLGGLSTPRPPAEIVAGRVVTVVGEDVTAAYQAGAQLALKLASKAGCRTAILKARSPSCGCGQIYDGSFSGRLIPGDGVFAALLKQAGIVVQTEEDKIIGMNETGE